MVLLLEHEKLLDLLLLMLVELLQLVELLGLPVASGDIGWEGEARGGGGGCG